MAGARCEAKMKRFLIGLAFLASSLLFSPNPSLAQCTGVFGTGQICGNPTGVSALPRAVGLGAMGVVRWASDQFFGSGVPWVDVKSGAHSCAIAVGDGSTDDRAAIQCYIDWAFANLNGAGGIVHLPPANFRIGSPGLVVKGSVFIQGSGKGNGGLTTGVDTTVVKFDNVTCTSGNGMADLTVFGRMAGGETQDAVVVGANCNTNISRAIIWGGHHGINTAGADGTYTDIYVCGWTGDNIFSTGANWYFDIKADSCSGPSTGNGFEQGATSGLAENFIYRMDLSCGTCTNSVVINDTTGTHAVTYFYGAIMSKPVVVTAAKITSFIGGEIGSTFSGAGQVNVMGALGSGSAPTGTATYNCVGNFSVGCPQIQALIYGDTTAAGTLTLQSTSNGSPSGDSVNIKGSTITLRNIGSGTSIVNVGVANTTAGQFNIAGASSGSQRWLPAAIASGVITWPAGTVDFSATGGASNVVVQASAGAIFTVRQLTVTDISGAAATATTIAKVKFQKFTVSGTYTPSTGLLFAVVECVGNGGGGGGVTGTAGNIYGGGGGGSGSYSRITLTAATIGVSQTVTIGSTGTGGAAGSNSGTAGGDVSLGTLCVGKGGSPGIFGSSGQVGTGGAGGIAGTGDIIAAGNPGNGGFFNQANVTQTFQTGIGGSSYFGGGATGSGVGAGNNANNYGSGGAGALTNSASNFGGGNGSTGIVVIQEFTNQ